MKQILLIEDNIAHRHMLKDLLKEEGYSVLEASDGEEGCYMYRRKPFDLIITDICMPEKDGNEVIVELKKAYPNVKIIAISGRGFMKGKHLLNVAQELGADHTIKKPFRIKELLSLVDSLLRG